MPSWIEISPQRPTSSTAYYLRNWVERVPCQYEEMQEAEVAAQEWGECWEPLSTMAENFSQVTKTSVSLPTAAAGWEGGFLYQRRNSCTPCYPSLWPHQTSLTSLGQQEQQFRWALLHGLELLHVSCTSCTISEHFLLKLIPSFFRGALEE